jgi:hypothetical protein
MTICAMVTIVSIVTIVTMLTIVTIAQMVIIGVFMSYILLALCKISPRQLHLPRLT